VWYSPQPKQKPIRLPRRHPLKTIPSGIGDEGIVGNWLFYYLKGGDHLHDFSPENNHGTIHGAKWTDEDLASWALEFDGTDDYVEIGEIGLEGATQFTIVGWLKPVDIHPSIEGFILVNGGSAANDTLFFANDAYSGGFKLNVNSAGVDITGGRLSATTYNFCVATYDDKAGNSYLYLDGSQVASGGTDGTVNSTAETVKLGGRDDAHFFGGKLGGVKVFVDRVLSESEIKTMYRETKPLYVR